MAAFELATLLVSLHALSEREILSPGVQDDTTTAVNHLQTILITLMLLQSATDDDEQSGDHRPDLLREARDAVDLASWFLLEPSRRLKYGEGRLTKICALVRFMLLRARVPASESKVYNLIDKVGKLSTHLSQLQDPPSHGNASSSNMQRGEIRWNGKIESDIVGREDEVRQLLARLTWKDGDQEALRLSIVWVVAEEPIGKTALVRSVYNRLEVDHSFQCRVWVQIPEEFVFKDLLVKILKQIPVPELKDLARKGDQYLKEILYKSLMELRYLIVFDNLPKAEVMDELMTLLMDSRNGSRVIVTTRVPQIPSIIYPWASPIDLHGLKRDESDLLLKECGSFSEDSELKATILRKCSDSPLTILLLRGLAVSSSITVGELDGKSTLDDIVALSYHKLPHLLKPCLLYLCLFPKDSEILTRRLFQLWHAEGLVPVLKFTAKECFEELVGRNWVHVVRRKKLSEEPKSCRVPSFLHDYLCEMATLLRLRKIHSNTKGTYHSEEPKVNGCLWIVNYQKSQKSAETDEHQHSNIQLRHLRSYVSFNKQKWVPRSREVEELLRPLITKGDWGLLRVLDLEGVYKPKLPDRLGNVLVNLRYLGLRWTVLDSIPESVGNMSHLETLDLKNTNVGNLPSSIWKVKSLQHLYMNEVCFGKSTNLRIRSVEFPNNLQTLWGLYIEAADSPMLDLLSKLTRIRKLGVTCNSPVVKEVTKCISNLPMLQSLKLRSRDLFKPSDISDQPSDLELSDMRKVESISDLYLLGSFPKRDSQDIPRDLSQRGGLELLPWNLRSLTLSMSGLDGGSMAVLTKFEELITLNLLAGSYTGQVLDFCRDSFPRLRVLKLWKLEKVEAARVDKTALRCLEELEIKCCKLLTSIDSLGHIEFLKQISLIKVKEELATNIKNGLTGKLVIDGKQLATPPSSRDVFIKKKQLVPPSSSPAQAAQDN